MPLDALAQVERLKEFFETVYEKKLLSLIKVGEKSVTIDFSELSKFDVELSEQLLNEPTEVIENAEVAIAQLELPIKYHIRARFTNIPKTQDIPIRNIRSIHLGAFMVIEGIVRQASDVRPQVVSAKFECPSCGAVHSILQVDSSFKEPTRCSCGRKGKFRMLSKELVDAQRLVLEEAPESLEGGEQPKKLSVFLKEDLVEPRMEKKTTPGSKVRIYGVIKEIPIQLKTGSQSTRYDLAAEANYIEPIQETFEEIDISKEDELKIKKLSKDPKVFNKFVASIAPSIYGYEEVKASLLLQLFSGTRKVMEDGVIRRGDIHTLLVGDPGCGKSQMLSFISKIAPKGRLVSGKGSSGAGLTAAVVRDEFLRGWSLEAGAMVLANNGICSIDELDKMSHEDRSALHEALEQQTVTISKANIQATLRAETTVLAAANPKYGRFDPMSPIAAQIDLPPSLINRFDLIFPIRDLPDRTKDERIAEHVLSIHKETKSLDLGIEKDIIRKYIAYAKQKIKPELTKEAIKEIKDFYVDLRNSVQSAADTGVKPIPISARQLEALIRLSEASAKVRLSNKVTKEDAKRAIILIKSCLMQVGIDRETGQLDIDRISTGITAAQRSKITIVREVISSLEAKGLKSIPIEDVVSLAVEKGVEEDKTEEIIEKLKRSGDIFSPKHGFIQKI